MKSDDNSTGKRVKKAVKESRMTQLEVADKAGMSKKHLHKIKTGLANPSIKALARIGWVVKKPVEWFLRRNNKKER